MTRRCVPGPHRIEDVLKGAPADPDEALALMWRFMALATPVLERCDDSSGTIIGIFHQACADLGQLAAKVRPEPQTLVGAVLDAVQDNG